jgi:hypothetical protein
MKICVLRPQSNDVFQFSIFREFHFTLVVSSSRDCSSTPFEIRNFFIFYVFVVFSAPSFMDVDVESLRVEASKTIDDTAWSTVTEPLTFLFFFSLGFNLLSVSC